MDNRNQKESFRKPPCLRARETHQGWDACDVGHAPQTPASAGAPWRPRSRVARAVRSAGSAGESRRPVPNALQGHRALPGSASGRRDDTRYWVGPATSKTGKDVSPGSRAGSRLPGGSLCLPVGSRRGRGSNGRDTERCTARRRSRGGRGAEERARRRGVPEALQGEGCCPRSTHRGQAVWSRSMLASDRAARACGGQRRPHGGPAERLMHPGLWLRARLRGSLGAGGRRVLRDLGAAAGTACDTCRRGRCSRQAARLPAVDGPCVPREQGGRVGAACWRGPRRRGQRAAGAPP